FAVFVGTFDARAARAVARLASLDVLGQLVDKSLVVVVDRQESGSRYRLLETVRQYATERLVDAGEADDARARHLRHYSSVRLPAADGWPTPNAREILDALEDDYDNVRGALEWATEA